MYKLYFKVKFNKNNKLSVRVKLFQTIQHTGQLFMLKMENQNYIPSNKFSGCCCSAGVAWSWLVNFVSPYLLVAARMLRLLSLTVMDYWTEPYRFVSSDRSCQFILLGRWFRSVLDHFESPVFYWPTGRRTKLYFWLCNCWECSRLMRLLCSYNEIIVKPHTFWSTSLL